jgi:hypothetical protein
MKMHMLRSAYNNAMVVPGALLSGLSVYAILAILVVPNRITIPASVIISIVVFGLTYLIVSENRRRQYDELAIKPSHQSVNDKGNRHALSSGQIIFLTVYIMQIAIVGLISKADTQLFDSWDHFSMMQTIDLVAAISLCFFLPGYAIVSVIESRKHRLKPTLVILLAYFFSLLLTGMTGYISGMMAYTGTEMKTLFVGLNLALLIIYISLNLISRMKINRSPHTGLQDKNRKWIPLIIKNKVELAVFASLVSLILLSTFYLYHGTIIGDQWFHHGKAMLFLAGAFTSVVDSSYPFFFHSVLASFFSISGVPSVNAYVSINVFNVITIFAFYYFFKEWISNSSWKRGALLACTLFILGSGFGWVNVIGLIGSTHYPISQHSALEILNTADLNTGYDILRRSATFITASPEPTGPLVLLALPAGFLLLGLIKENISSKFRYIAILTSISIIGILSHDEFYLFISVGSIAPVIFRLPQRKNSVYIALIISILLVFVADLVYPIKYYTETQVFGIPLLALVLFFVCLMWVLYLCRTFEWIGYVHVLRRIKTVPAIRLSLGILIVCVFCYFYVLSFIVWGELSLEKIEMQQHDKHTPWYLYVIKLGVPGLFGLAFVLSYLFKKYEKEVFIFVILAVVALLAGPYYNEYRFSKYVMAGMAGFASLLVYRIIIFIPSISLRPLLGGLLMGLVVTSSSLSFLLFLGFTALALQNPNFDKFHESLERRIFPSPQDIHFLRFLHNNLIDLKTDNVTVSGNWYGVNSKLEGFVGTSLASLPTFLRSPFTLDSSALAGFYNLLNYSNSRYIIWAKNEAIDLNAKQVLYFALQNFERVYEDNNYIVVAVPAFAPPTPPETAEVAIVNQQDGLLLTSLVSNQKSLPYNNQSFKVTGNKFIKTSENENGTDGVTIFGDQKRITLWSKPFQQRDSVNYIEAKFRILDEDLIRNNIGVVWQDQKKQYFVSLSDKGLQLSEKMNRSDTGKESILLQNSQIIKEKGKLYTLKIVIFKDSIKIYLDEFPRLQIQKPPFENTYISKIGLRTFRNVASFEPVKIGQISDVGEKNYQREIYYRDYYPLSALALSNASYDIFLDADLSALSKNKVIIPRDPVGEDWLISRYLQYVNGGGTLIVINTENNFDGEFGKLMSIKGENKSNFDSISNPATGQTLNVSGIVSTVKSDIPNATVKSFYFYNKQRVAPFIIEKSYGVNGGRIVFVNSAGYFDAIFNSPPHYFSTLANMLSFIDLNVERYYKESPTPTKDLVGARFFDNLKISGKAIFNSTSLLFPDHSYVLHASDISVSDHRNDSEHKYESIQTQFKGSQIKNLTLNGPYEVIVTSRGVLELPSASAQYNYIGIPILRGSDMKLKLSPGARAEFMIGNDTRDSTRSVKITGEEIQFHGISLQPSLPNVEDRPYNISSILLKSPKIEVNGSTTFEQFYNPDQAFNKVRPLQIDGNLTMQLNQIDDILDTQDRTKTRIVTYLDLVKIEGNTNTTMINQKAMFRIPGDISDEAKEKGIDVPWLKAMSSVSSIFVIILILFTATLLIWKLWPKMKSQLQ